MSTQETTTDSIQAVSFNIINNAGKKEDYAIPIEKVREIRAVEKITKVPRSEPFVLGIMNLRGLIIPVIDVKKKLGLCSEQKSNSKQRILVADLNGSLTGLLVDEVDQVMKIQTSEIEAPPQGAFDSYHYVQGIAKMGEKLVILLDVDGLLLGQKQQKQESTVNETENKTSPESQSDPQPASQPAPQSKQEPTESPDDSDINSLDDIPDELAEVFKEDEQGIPPAQIVRDT